MEGVPEGTGGNMRPLRGAPEGTGQAAARRAPRLRLILIAVVVAAYLGFRLVQGVLWLAAWLPRHL